MTLRRFLILPLSVLLLALVLVSTTNVLPAANAAGGAPFGVYRGSGRADLVSDYQTWLGKPVTHVVDFWGATPVDSTTPWMKIDDPAWICGVWAGTSWQLALSVAILPNTNFTLEAGARGDYNAHWVSFARGLVARGCGDAILRLGWEFNGKFYPWAAGGREASFAAYWRQIVTSMRSVTGQAFRFDWTPLAGNTNANVEAAYPGDAYVDIIGLDAYDGSPVHTSAADRWNDQVTRVYGLNWHRNFALAHGKPMSFPEWGLTVRYTDNLGGGDNPYYITKMYDWIQANNIVYASYFEVDAKDAAHRLMTTQFPNSSAEYRRLIQSGSATPTTTTTAPSGTTTTTAPSTTPTTAPSTTTTTTAPSTTPAPIVSIWTASESPKTISSDSRAVELGVKFRSDVAGKILGIRFYKGAGNTGTHVGTLYSRGGAVLARATFTNESASGWQEVRFSTPVSIQAGTTYVAAYHAPSGHYGSTMQTFSGPVDRPPLHALKKGVDGANSVYAYSATPKFPTTGSKKAENYWVDVLFQRG